MTVPVGCPQKSLVWGKNIAGTFGYLAVLFLEVLDPMELSLGPKLITYPNPVIAEMLNGLKDPVVEQFGEASLGRS